MKALLSLISVLLISCSTAIVPQVVETSNLTGDVVEINLGQNPEEGAGDVIDFYSFVTVDKYDKENGVLSISIWKKYPDNMTQTEVFSYHLFKDVPMVNILLHKNDCLQMVWKIKQDNVVLYFSDGVKEICHSHLK